MLQALCRGGQRGQGGLNTDRVPDQRGSDKAQERAQGSGENEAAEGNQRRERRGPHTELVGSGR